MNVDLPCLKFVHLLIIPFGELDFFFYILINTHVGLVSLISHNEKRMKLDMPKAKNK